MIIDRLERELWAMTIRARAASAATPSAPSTGRSLS